MKFVQFFPEDSAVLLTRRKISAIIEVKYCRLSEFREYVFLEYF